MLSNLHFERVEKHDFVLRNLPNRVHPKWVGGTIPLISFLGVGVKHGVFGAQNFLIMQLSLKSKTSYLITCNIYCSLKIFMSDWQFRIFFFNLDTQEFEQFQTSLGKFRKFGLVQTNFTGLVKFKHVQTSQDKFRHALTSLKDNISLPVPR